MTEHDPAPTPPHSARSSFFQWLRSLGLVRGDDGWVAGVCSAIARRTGLDPLLVRGIVMVIAVLGGPVGLAYAVGWALIPDSRGSIHAERLLNKQFSPAMIAIAALALFSLSPLWRGFWFEGVPLGWGMPGWMDVTFRTLWIVGLSVAAVWLFVVVVRKFGGQQPAVKKNRPGSTDHNDRYPDDGRYNATPRTAAATKPTQASAPMPSAYAEPARPIPAAETSHTTTTTAEYNHYGYDTGSARDSRPNQGSPLPPKEQFPPASTGIPRPRNRAASGAFTVIFLGLALMAAAIAGAFSAAFTRDSVLFSAAIAALAVIAIGIVISGIRGRTSGALSPFAIVLAIVLASTGVFPAGTNFATFGKNTFTVAEIGPGEASGSVMLAGNVVLDASPITGYLTEEATIDLWVGAGNITVIVPDGIPVLAQANAVGGNVNFRSSTGTTRRGAFPFIHLNYDYGPVTDNATLLIRVWTLGGNITFVPESEYRP